MVILNQRLRLDDNNIRIKLEVSFTANNAVLQYAKVIRAEYFDCKK